MYRMFAFCGQYKLKGLDLGDKFKTTKVTNMNNMFAHCAQLSGEYIDISSMTFDAVTDYTNIFDYCAYQGKSQYSDAKIYVNSASRNFVVTNKELTWQEANIIVGSI